MSRSITSLHYGTSLFILSILFSRVEQCGQYTIPVLQVSPYKVVDGDEFLKLNSIYVLVKQTGGVLFC